MNPVRDDTATTACPACGAAFAPESRQRYCSTTCRQRAWRRRREAPTPPVPAKPTTVYECDSCAARALGEQYCVECRTFMRRVGAGGPCPHCDELVALQHTSSATTNSVPPPGGDDIHDYFDLSATLHGLGASPGWLVALADDVQDPMAPLHSELFDVGGTGFRHPQPVQAEQHREGGVVAVKAFSREQERAQRGTVHPVTLRRLDLGPADVLGGIR
jgi:hypothetical protein